jgi:hypothetical protein
VGTRALAPGGDVAVPVGAAGVMTDVRSASAFVSPSSRRRVDSGERDRFSEAASTTNPAALSVARIDAASARGMPTRGAARSRAVSV